jgi:hypothetical protein
MTPKERADLLSRWIKPSSESEQKQQDRAESMVANAIKGCAALAASSVSVYTKGSYPNNTNVRIDSDVDVVVELSDCIYWGYRSGVTPPTSKPSAYSGMWTPVTWRDAVCGALVAVFGASAIDTSGKIAIKIRPVAGSRPSADVVPSFEYQRYNDAERTKWDVGSCVFPRDDSVKTINWPAQQLANGRKLNTATGSRYKNYVRALKNAENALAKAGTVKELPSYFMECLVYNASESALRTGTLDGGFRATLVDLWEKLEAEATETKMVEPNWMKYLFGTGKKWTLQDAKDLVLGTWGYLAYGG